MTDKPFKPVVMDVEARSYAWCACGRSKNQPFCDGSHETTGMTPKVVRFEEKKKVAWCMCKATATPPFCDGSHKHVNG